MNNYTLQKKLENTMGFSDKEAKIYLILLTAGELTASEIAQKASIKRTTVYNIIPKLLRDGLIQKTIDNKKTLYFIQNTRDLHTRLEEKTDSIAKLIPHLESVHELKRIHTKITHHEGIGGVHQLYQTMMNELLPGDSIRTVIGVHYLENIVAVDTLQKYIDQRIEKNITNKMIATRSPVSEKLKATAQNNLREIKLVDPHEWDFGVDMKIYANKVSFLSYREDFFGLTIESNEICRLQKIMFENIWKILN